MCKQYSQSSRRLFLTACGHFLVCAILCLEAVRARGADQTNQTDSGSVGLILKRQSEYPMIIEIVAGGPAARNQILRVGDLISAVSIDGSESGFVSVRGASKETLATMLNGGAGSPVAIRAMLKRLGGEQTETLIRLFRESPVRFHLPDGLPARGFLYDFRMAELQLTTDHIAKLRRIQPPEWLQVTNGMRSNDIVRLIGEPVEVRPGRGINDTSWRYGTVVNISEESGKPGCADLRLTNGAVSETFRIKQPLEPRCRVEILSRNTEP